MKLILTLTLFFGLQCFAGEAEPENNRAIEVKFYGGITGFDAGAYRALKAAMTSFIVDGTVDHFITRAVGREGGSTFCVELNPNPALTLDPILKVLNCIHPADNSYYVFTPIATCQP
jgi:hypothetical protein